MRCKLLNKKKKEDYGFFLYLFFYYYFYSYYNSSLVTVLPLQNWFHRNGHRASLCDGWNAIVLSLLENKLTKNYIYGRKKRKRKKNTMHFHIRKLDCLTYKLQNLLPPYWVTIGSEPTIHYNRDLGLTALFV